MASKSLTDPLLRKQMMSKQLLQPTPAFPATTYPPLKTYYDRGTTPMSGHEFHLTEALDKPLSQFTGEELMELAVELRDDGWREREEQIKNVATKYTQVWRGEVNNAYSSSGNLMKRNVVVQFSFPATHSAPGGMGTVYYGSAANSTSFTIALPVDLPEDYVYAFAERIARDVMEGM